ncbi:MAG: hypothetical protein AB1407_00270 [Spirochaetota bacterium]
MDPVAAEPPWASKLTAIWFGASPAEPMPLASDWSSLKDFALNPKPATSQPEKAKAKTAAMTAIMINDPLFRDILFPPTQE